MATKYTDLEIFCKKHIINPYRNMMVLEWCGHSHDCSCDNSNMTVDEVVDYINKHEDTEWWKCVTGRLQGISKGQGFYFPKYIKHELLDLIAPHIK